MEISSSSPSSCFGTCAVSGTLTFAPYSSRSSAMSRFERTATYHGVQPCTHTVKAQCQKNWEEGRDWGVKQLLALMCCVWHLTAWFLALTLTVGVSSSIRTVFSSPAMHARWRGVEPWHCLFPRYHCVSASCEAGPCMGEGGGVSLLETDAMTRRNSRFCRSCSHPLPR